MNTRPLKRNLYRLFMLLCLLGLFPTQSLAWGGKGHRIVAMIATEHLTPTARDAVSDLLGSESLSAVAVFADEVRNARPSTRQWHFVDIQLADKDYKPERDCIETPGGDCIVAAISRSKATLGSSSASRNDRIEALKFLVHFVGDIHQPLHCADNDDRGGNGVKVTFLGKRSNLHAVWDSGIIDQADLTDREFADELLADLTPAKIAAIQKGNEIDWALEAHKLAVNNAYKIARNRRLGVAYYDRNFAIVDSQLTRGGLRLAMVLNNLFK